MITRSRTGVNTEKGGFKSPTPDRTGSERAGSEEEGGRPVGQKGSRRHHRRWSGPGELSGGSGRPVEGHPGVAPWCTGRDCYTGSRGWARERANVRRIRSNGESQRGVVAMHPFLSKVPSIHLLTFPSHW